MATSAINRSVARWTSVSDATCPTAGTRRQFSLAPICAGDITDILSWACSEDVAARGGQYSATEESLVQVRAVARWLADEGARPWLVLNGRVGTGKTTVARAICRVVRAIREKARRECAVAALDRTDRDTSLDDVWARLDRLPIVLNVTAGTVADILASAGDSRAEVLKGEGLLVIDDLGTEPSVVNDFGTRMTPLADLLYTRYDMMLPTVITTNLRPEDIAVVYGERVSDRFAEMADWIGFGAGSYRGLNRVKP